MIISIFGNNDFERERRANYHLTKQQREKTQRE